MLTTRFSRKFVAWGLFVCAVSLAWGVLIKPLGDWVWASRELREDLRFALVRAQAAREGGGADQASLLAARTGLAEWLLSGRDEAEAAAQLQSVADALLRQAGLRVDSVQAAPGSAHHGLVRLPLELRVRGAQSAVMNWLSGLEGGSPFLAVERVVLRAEGEDLAVEMNLAGFWLPAFDKTEGQP